ncbi:MAG: hypothetical protein IH606_02515 [Burkholderiales bacterium]|nr:hypothetical protein [Burkholderiales bacterium]
MKLRAGARSLAAVCAALVACTPELDWRELSVPGARFAVLLPCKARHEARTLNTAAGALTMTMYACSPKRGTMGVAFTDYSAEGLAANHGRAQLDAARDALLRNIQGSVRSDEEIEVAGLPGRQIYAEGQATVLKARFVVSGSRLYQIAYVGIRDDVAMADIDMFLSSFKLLR